MPGSVIGLWMLEVSRWRDRTYHQRVKIEAMETTPIGTPTIAPSRVVCEAWLGVGAGVDVFAGGRLAPVSGVVFDEIGLVAMFVTVNFSDKIKLKVRKNRNQTCIELDI